MTVAKPWLNPAQTGPITVAGDSPGAEVWQFKTPELNLDNFASEFRFAVFYRVQATGEVFWDNNFGQDYRNSKADGATVG